LWALSDLHVSHPENRGVLDSFPALPDDWLILVGDVTHRPEQLDQCFRRLAPKFRQVVWVPGNHELWTVPDAAPQLGGVALYERLVRIARSRGVLTPEDSYPVVELRDGPVLIAPLFLLYDYSFRPRHVGRDEVVPWARETGAVCSDELMLHPDPFPDRDSWCAARCRDAAARLASYPADLPKILVNHFPLEEQHAVLPRIPRFTPCAGPAERGVGTAASTPAPSCTATSTSGAPNGSTACPSRRCPSGTRSNGIAAAGSVPTCAK